MTVSHEVTSEIKSKPNNVVSLSCGNFRDKVVDNSSFQADERYRGDASNLGVSKAAPVANAEKKKQSPGKSRPQSIRNLVPDLSSGESKILPPQKRNSFMMKSVAEAALEKDVADQVCGV